MQELKFIEDFTEIFKSLLRYGVSPWNLESVETNLQALFKDFRSSQKANELYDIIADFPKKEETTKETKTTNIEVA